MSNKNATIVLFKNSKRNEVFLVFRSDYPVWTTTGGAVEKGEIPNKAATREAFEETGFKVKIVKKVGVYKYKANESHLFEGAKIYGKFKPEFPGCKGRWFGVDKLPVSMTDITKRRIYDCINHKGKPFEKKLKPLSLIGNFHLLLFHPLASIKYINKYFKKL